MYMLAGIIVVAGGVVVATTALNRTRLKHKQTIVFFDNGCQLCSRSVRFILKHDTKERFKFAPLRSELSKQWLERLDVPLSQFDSLVLLDGSGPDVYVRSAAVIRIARYLDGFWYWGALAYLLPAPIRDKMYDWIAKHRTLFNHRQDCLLPTAELSSRFIHMPPKIDN